MIKLYGISGSRALRSIWAIEEVGVEYELVQTHFMGDSKKPDYLAINPNGRIPTLVDGDLTLYESMAINLYLAEQYGGALWPAATTHGSPHALQWSFWGISELEPHLMVMVLHKLMLPEEQRSPDLVTTAEKGMQRPLKVLEAHLADRKHLLGGDFTIVDLNVASVLSMASMVGFDVSGFERVSDWLSRCTSRPAFGRARAL
jgi:glutathione S-transferase